jgi:mono/diheme cytochrome c family protein
MLGKAALGLKCGLGVVAFCAALLALAGLPRSVSAAEKDMTDKGQVLVEQNCGRCHATGKEGASPHAEAPPFRTLSSKYPVEDLAESLAEGIVSGHPEMPIFVFEPQDVAAIIDYLESIQDVPSASLGEAPAEVPADTPPQAQ